MSPWPLSIQHAPRFSGPAALHEPLASSRPAWLPQRGAQQRQPQPGVSPPVCEQRPHSPLPSDPILALCTARSPRCPAASRDSSPHRGQTHPRLHPQPNHPLQHFLLTTVSSSSGTPLPARPHSLPPFPKHTHTPTRQRFPAWLPHHCVQQLGHAQRAHAAQRQPPDGGVQVLAVVQQRLRRQRAQRQFAGRGGQLRCAQRSAVPTAAAARATLSSSHRECQPRAYKTAPMSTAQPAWLYACRNV